MTTLHLRKSIDRPPLRLGFLLILLALILLALSPTARAEDGGLPNDSTAEGINALVNQNNSGFGNTAMGWNALGVLTGASFNTATGYKALLNNNGDNNTADGSQALANNTNGTWNTAAGANALLSNTTGSVNTALGIVRSHRTQTARRIQPPVQRRSLRIQAAITTRLHGLLTLESNTAGHDNIAEGFQALANNTSGSSNIALGSNAGINLTTGSNNIDVGAPGTAGESRKVRIGKQGTQTATFIAGIYNVNEGGTIKPLYINRMVR